MLAPQFKRPTAKSVRDFNKMLQEKYGAKKPVKKTKRKAKGKANEG